MSRILSPAKTIRTYSGHNVNVFEPNLDSIKIEDIATALSRQPRFAGHLLVNYSVAQHCIRCAEVAPPELKLCALLHDITEAYIGDLASPIKDEIPQYKEIEDRLMAFISTKFKIPYPFPEVIKQIDISVRHEEWDELMVKNRGWASNIFFRIKYLYLHLTAKRRFLKVYRQLTK